ncbi:conserved hypothetical protein [Ixodes scapularis]|uniref:Cuticle protein n=1 Tax=Ixodes scapularis TaxID=6945 RepID=B7P5Q3_IXOSC|nr:conserved hypothetical protein [Ixodes scapularis]|eukprot:XP_002407793.1 conserved hypothetical protein [Ixodes scapularis]
MIAQAPQANKFGYNIVDNYGNHQSRHEVSDAHNRRVGSYSFTDAHGRARKVSYVADGHGFRAVVHTNEPGTAASRPAAAAYNTPVVHKAPQANKFGYNIVDNYGNHQSRHEVSDAHNRRVGSYSFRDAHGRARQVNYVADGHGFRAVVHTNEPGTAASRPAAAAYNTPVVHKIGVTFLK